MRTAAVNRGLLHIAIIAVAAIGLVACDSVGGGVDAASSHSNNWAVLVCTSRYWFNYRHIANVLSIYHTVKQMGIPDSNIILMLPDDMACNPRNSFAAHVHNDRTRSINLYSSDVEVDYRGTEVSVESFIRVLTGRHASSVSRSKRVNSDARSNVLVYLTGHGGDEFLKFQDAEEISSWDFGDALRQMKIQNRFNRLLFMVDTCQAATLQQYVTDVPGVVAVGSSKKGENSYSLTHNEEVGVAVIDRFTYYTLEFFQKHTRSATHAARNRQPVPAMPTIQQLFSSYDYSLLHSNAAWSGPLTPALTRIPVSDFFGAVSDVIILGSTPANAAPNNTRQQPTKFGHARSRAPPAPATAAAAKQSAAPKPAARSSVPTAAASSDDVTRRLILAGTIFGAIVTVTLAGIVVDCHRSQHRHRRR